MLSRAFKPARGDGASPATRLMAVVLMAGVTLGALTGCPGGSADRTAAAPAPSAATEPDAAPEPDVPAPSAPGRTDGGTGHTTATAAYEGDLFAGGGGRTSPQVCLRLEQQWKRWDDVYRTTLRQIVAADKVWHAPSYLLLQMDYAGARGAYWGNRYRRECTV